MFDKLIESNSVEAEFKPRRKFFMVSSVVVGILFVTAVVASLYAQELDLGTNSFELVEMIAPVAADAPEPEPPRQQPQQQNDQQQTSQLPNRQQLIARVDQPPTKVPDAISSERFENLTVPQGPFTNNPDKPDTNGNGTSGSNSANSSLESEVVATEPVVTKVPPPVAKAEPKKTVTQTKGVVNGYAIDLPKPTYPAAAKAIRMSGVVSVQVLIDEYGTVVSARAIDGPAIFKTEAERSAKRAKFKPTYLSDQPTKVTGIIVYKFTM